MSYTIQKTSINPDQLINFFVVNRMRNLTASEFKVFMLIYAYTYGSCKQEAQIPLDTFTEVTGLTKNTVLKAISSLIDYEQILKFTHTRIHTYSLNSVSIFGKERNGMHVQKYHITHKHTPMQDFKDA